MKKTILIAIVTMIAPIIFAQNSDSKAMKLLDKVSSKTDSYKDINISFTYSMHNNTENIHQKKSGTALIQKDKYLIDIDDITILFDGKKRYSIIDDEINISNADNMGGMSSPLQILNMYKEGYIVKWDIKQHVPNKTIQYVKLIPIDSESEYSYILIGSDIKTNNLYNAIYIDKQGSEFKVQLNNIEANTNISDKVFFFDKKKYPEPEYIYTNMDE